MNEDTSNNILIEISNNDIFEESITSILTPLISPPEPTPEQRLLESIFSLPNLPATPHQTQLRSPYVFPPPPPLPAWANMGNGNLFSIPEVSSNQLQFTWNNNPMPPNRINLSISGERIRPRRRGFFETRRTRSRRLNNRSVILNAINTIINDDMSGITNLTNRVLEQSLYQDPGSYKKVLNEKGKDTIKITKYSKEKFTDKRCPITYIEFKEGQEVSELPCTHIFTSEAILDWLENEKAECPICRYKLLSKEIKKDFDFDLDISENILPNTRNRYIFNRPLNNNINTDVDMQRAILASIQNENNQEGENNTEQDLLQNQYSILPWEEEEVENTINSDEDIEDVFTEDSWGEFSSDDEDLLDGSFGEEIMEVEHIYPPPPPPPSTPPLLQTETEIENINSSSQENIEDIFNVVFDEIVDEEIV